MNKETETDALLKRCAVTYDTKVHEKWRNELAADLNHILGRVQWTLESSNPPNEADECDIEFAQAALRVVDRVARFEDIARR